MKKLSIILSLFLYCAVLDAQSIYPACENENILINPKLSVKAKPNQNMLESDSVYIKAVRMSKHFWRKTKTDLKGAYCKLDSNKLKISIWRGEPDYTVSSPMFEISKDLTYTASWYFWSDYDEYNGSHDTTCCADISKLIINKLNFTSGDTISISYNTMLQFNENSKYKSKGKIWCIIE